jgi:hypothetical protein
MIWNQTVFSKKNRNLKTGGQLMDEYHILTSGENNSAPNRVLRDLRARGRRYHEPLMAFIHRLEEGMFVGLMGKNEAVMGAQHEFGREATVSRFSGPGRQIAFNHAYHCPASANPTVPDLVTLCKQQRVDLLHILTEAHAGREPIPMEPVAFASQRIAGTDWDRVAAEVDAGKCQGGFFSMDGRLIERFETISENVTKEAQKNGAGYDTGIYSIGRHSEGERNVFRHDRGRRNWHSDNGVGGMGADPSRRKATPTSRLDRSELTAHHEAKYPLPSHVDEAPALHDVVGRKMRRAGVGLCQAANNLLLAISSKPDGQ